MKNYIIKFLILISSFIVLNGCSVWEDFTTYFNRWYNIKQIFNEIELDIQSQKKNIFSIEPLILSGNSRTNLPKLVDKCSDLLQFNKNSSFVDDALLILGKAFYYQANYQKSKRKFEELLSTEPSEKIKLEAELWIAKCELQMRNYSTGLNLLRTVGATAIVKDYQNIIEESFIEEIKYFKTIEDYSTAIELLNKLLNYTSDDELLALTYLELGDLYSIEENYSKAVESYLSAIEYTSDFDIETKATLNYASSLRLNNQLEESLEFLEALRTKDKFLESLPQIELEIGRINAELKNFDDALETFKKIDTTYKNSSFSAVAVYEIGKIYEYHLSNFDSAAKYYNIAQLNNPPREYQKEVTLKNNLFNSYLRLRKSIDNNDRQLFYALNPEIYKQDSIAYVQDSLKIIQEYLEKKELASIWNNIEEGKKVTINYLSLRDSIFVRDSIKLADSLNKIFTQLEPDSIITILISKAFFRDSVKVVDSLKLEGIFLEPDEISALLFDRRSKLISPTTNTKNIIELGSTIPVDSLNFKKNPPILPKVPINDLKNSIAKNRLELANLFFGEMNIPDSAYKLYSEIVKDFDSTNYYPEALYGLGTYYLTINQKSKSDSLFKKIYDEYKTISIVNSAANKLGLPLIDLTFDPGKELYIKAENYIKQKDYKSGIKQFIDISKNLPESKFAAKGLYAAGFILENDLKLLDSAVAVYDTLITKYPSSEFVRIIAMKITIYKQEKARIQRELEEAQKKVASLEEENISPAFQNKIEEDIPQTEEEKKLIESKQEITEKEVNKFPNKKKLERLWNPRNHRR